GCSDGDGSGVASRGVPQWCHPEPRRRRRTRTNLAAIPPRARLRPNTDRPRRGNAHSADKSPARLGPREPRPVARIRRMVLRLSLVFLLAGCASYTRIDQLTNTRAIWAIDVEDDSGRVLYARNAHKLMVPAS